MGFASGDRRRSRRAQSSNDYGLKASDESLSHGFLPANTIAALLIQAAYTFVYMLGYFRRVLGRVRTGAPSCRDIWTNGPRGCSRWRSPKCNLAVSDIRPGCQGGSNRTCTHTSFTSGSRRSRCSGSAFKTFAMPQPLAVIDILTSIFLPAQSSEVTLQSSIIAQPPCNRRTGPASSRLAARYAFRACRVRLPRSASRLRDRSLMQGSRRGVDAPGQPTSDLLDDPHVAVGIIEEDI